MAKNHRRLAVAVIDLAFLCFAAIAVYHLSHKPFIPRDLDSPYPLKVNGTLVSNGEELEFFVSWLEVGDEVIIERPVGSPEQSLHLENFYVTPLIIFDTFITMLIFGVGTFVFYKRPGEKASFIFHLTSMLVAADIIGTKTLYALKLEWIGYPLSAIYFILYTIVPVMFLHFTFVFPSVRWKNYSRLISILYGLGTMIGLWYAWLYLNAASAQSLELYRSTSTISMLQNGFVFAFILLGVTNFIFSYKQAANSIEKKKIRWILYGLSIGPSPYIFLWTLPIALGSSPWIPEVWFKVFILLIPFTFAISILKHHVMDIDLIMNRSTVYAIVIAIGLIAYLLVIGISAEIITTFTTQISLIVSTITAAILAFLFEPVRQRVQKFVDRSFFRIQYDFRLAQHRFIEEIKQCFDVQSIANLIVRRTDELLPVERIGVFRISTNNRLKLIAHKNFESLEKHSVHLAVSELKSRLDLPIALPENIEPGVMYEIADVEVFKRWGMVLVFPMISEHLENSGFFVLGKKKSGGRFTSEDIDLINTVTTQAELTIERIELQHKLALQHAETKRLEEINQLKSYFVSSVSHDLKTPLTSIKMFAELLRTKKNISKIETTEYLEIIEGESERLTRLINNVLDFSRIERGVKEYHFTDIEMNFLVEYVLRTMKYQLKMENFNVYTKLCDKDCYLSADKDAVTEALVNLISNAIKYSHDKKEIFISTFRQNGFVALQVKDQGIGIPSDDIEHIFEPFYRARESRTQGAGGAGLGLAIVKHIVDAHHGKVEVQSLPGQGSTFTLLFPLSLEE